MAGEFQRLECACCFLPWFRPCCLSEALTTLGWGCWGALHKLHKLGRHWESIKSWFPLCLYLPIVRRWCSPISVGLEEGEMPKPGCLPCFTPCAPVW